MRKKQTMKAVLHLPETPEALQELRNQFCAFYLAQVELQIQRYDLSPAQRAAVFAGLAAEYKAKQ